PSGRGRSRGGFGSTGCLRGFTLIELLVTVVIATILISIAVPTYQTQVRKSRRTEATTTALDAAAREERYYATQNQYTADTGQLGYTSSSGSFPYTTGSYYQITSIAVTAPSATTSSGVTTVSTGTFTVTVQPFTGSSQAADTSCQTWTITQTGQKAALDANGDNATSTCWP
ncbi:MAG TPA: type IV pilin protein, partial [Steroidobacteraceae bacterium]|nr:type IV pilin protein [Steroidobacteraceae bacterium]